jgi:purine nucleosidase
MKLLLISTDPGSDVDDALCLGYLLKNPEAKIVGITTVTQPSKDRARLCSALCHAAGRGEIPIVPGTEFPLDDRTLRRQTDAPQARVLLNWRHDDIFPSESASAFMSRVIRAHPGKVTLLAIGPQTDVAQLVAQDPEAVSLLGALVLMGGMIEPQGTFNRRTREWNMKLDPEAADIVLGSRLVQQRYVPADVTAQVAKRKREFRHWLRNGKCPIHGLLTDLAAIWFERHQKVTFHDPLAATTIFDDRICSFERGLMSVVTKPRNQAGKTFWRSDPFGPHEMATGVDPGRFFDHLSYILGV